MKYLFLELLGSEGENDRLDDKEWVKGFLENRGLHVCKPGVEEIGRLKTLRQQGWEVQYQEYAQFEGHDLPNRLTLTYVPDPAAVDMPAMEVRLVIERWAQVQ